MPYFKLVLLLGFKILGFITLHAILDFKILGVIGRLKGLSFPPNLSCPDSFLPPKPPPEKSNNKKS